MYLAAVGRSFMSARGILPPQSGCQLSVLGHCLHVPMYSGNRLMLDVAVVFFSLIPGEISSFVLDLVVTCV